MHLEELIGKPNHLLSDEELETKMKELQKLKVRGMKAASTPKSKAAPRPKSNKDKRIENAVKDLTPAQKQKLKELLGQ